MIILTYQNVKMSELNENDGMQHLKALLIAIQPSLGNLGGDYAFICHDLLSNLHNFETIEDVSAEELLMISDLLNLLDPRDDPSLPVIANTKLPRELCPISDLHFWAIRNAIKVGLEFETFCSKEE